MIRKSLLVLVLALFATSPLFAAHVDKAKEDTMLALTGVVTSPFNKAPKDQAGSITIARGEVFTKALSHETGIKAHGNVVIQITGTLADLLIKEVGLVTGTGVAVGRGVIYLFGDLAEALLGVTQEVYAVTKEKVLEGVSFLVVTGGEAVTLLKVYVVEMTSRLADKAHEFGNITVASYEDGRDWVIRLLHLGFEYGASGAVVWNPFFAYDRAMEGVERISMRSGEAIYWGTTTIGDLFSYLAGQDNTAFGTMLSRTGVLVGVAAYNGLYVIGDTALKAKEIVQNPFLSITLAADATGKILELAGNTVERGTEIVAGFITGSLENAQWVMEAGWVGVQHVVIVAGKGFEKAVELGEGAVAFFKYVGENAWERVIGILNPCTHLQTVHQFFANIHDAVVSVVHDVWEFIKHPFGLGR